MAKYTTQIGIFNCLKLYHKYIDRTVPICGRYFHNERWYIFLRNSKQGSPALFSYNRKAPLCDWCIQCPIKLIYNTRISGSKSTRWIWSNLCPYINKLPKIHAMQTVGFQDVTQVLTAESFVNIRTCMYHTRMSLCVCARMCMCMCVHVYVKAYLTYMCMSNQL